ncbi:hypothetical protein [Streptomyces sp. NPDC051662]|uniref:ATP-grasp domain-containing protein n=1 Tax=Streptomyces sp. NPDC051662 TaxID=3154750 RepID=UPI003426D6FF
MMRDLRHVVIVDRSDYGKYRFPDGRPFLDPERYKVTFLTRPGRGRDVRSEDAVTVMHTDTYSEQDVLKCVPALAAGRPVDAVVSLSEWTLLPAARLREALGVPGPGWQRMLPLRDKVRMKKHFAAHGVRTPEFMTIERPGEAEDLLKRHGAVVLKPVDSMGSAGVHLVGSRSELQRLDREGLKNGCRYEAEEFIDGRLFHIDSVVDHGSAVVATASTMLDPDTVFPLGGACRSVLLDDGPERDTALAYNDQVLATLPWFSGVTHLQFFLDRAGHPVFCEIGGRPGGGGIAPAFRHRFGVSLVRAALLPQVGEAFPEFREIRPPAERSSGHVVVYPRDLGTLVSYDRVPQEEWIVQFSPLYRAGQRIVPASSWGQGIAMITVCGPNSRTVVQRLDEARQALRVAVRP